MKPLVVLLDSALVPDSVDCSIEQGILDGACELRQVFVEGEEDIVAAAGNADAVLLWHHVELNRAVLERLHRCRVVVRNGVGFDNVDTQAAGELGIAVCNVPDYGTEEVADHAIALILTLTRKLLPAWAAVRQGEWNWRTAGVVRRTSAQTVGILGLGRIGTATALRAKALGFRVVFFDPYLPSGVEKALGLARVTTLRSLLESIDVLSIHTPLTAETRHMVDAAAIRAMKAGSVIVNTARGPVVEEGALVAALESGHVSGAGLDVVDREPHLSPSLLAHPNCIVTPHSAFYSEESWIEMREKSAGAVLSVLRGQVPANIINQQLLRAGAAA